MKVAYQLRWLPASAPASALLVSGHQPLDVLRVCAELGVDPLPPIHALADGFLLKLSVASEKRLAGVIRLRGLSEHLFVPVNAELIPPLLPDESSALVNKRGLVFLPGARVLQYDPARPIPLGALMRLDPVERRAWSALPIPATLAECVTEISLNAVEPSAEQILQAGGEGIGTENPTLQGGNLPDQLLGNALFQFGKGLAWLGQAMNAKLLAGVGAKLLGGALSFMPKLSEKLLGEQEAQLRELLRQFRAGNIEEALKHALPLGGDPSRGQAPAQSARLPTHNLFYSLLNLLGSSGQAGGASIWVTPDNTYHELVREYRKQADEAVRRGDFRRAAFIYAKLLNEYHGAAKALAQGGLHRDAAVLYEKKLNDSLSAAREWEAAGEFERALHLYRRSGNHLEAGDLLRRIGEEESAVQEFRIAAVKLVENGKDAFDAGELLRLHAQRPDLAMSYYEKGWASRPGGKDLSCATRIVQQLALAGKTAPFLTLLTEAEAFLHDRDPASSANFFTEIASLARTPALEPIADDLRDRALIGIARKLRQAADLKQTPANLFATPSVWPVPLASDAQHALNAVGKRSAALSKLVHQILQAGNTSQVTAIAQMPVSGEVFLGFEDGGVVVFQPSSGELHELTRENGPILSIVVDPSKAYLLVLSKLESDKSALRVFRREIGYRMIGHHQLTVNARAWMALPASNGEANCAILCHGNEYLLFSMPNLVVTDMTDSALVAGAREIPEAVVYGMMENDSTTSSLWMLMLYDQRADLRTGTTIRRKSRSYSLDRVPCIGVESTLCQVPLRAVMLDHETLELTGLDMDYGLCRTTLCLNNSSANTIQFHPVGGARYGAFACVHADLIAGVHAQGIDWWTPSRARPVQTKIALDNPVAAFPLPQTREILIVGAGGQLTRVPIAE